MRGADGPLFRPGYAMGKEERGYTPRSGEKGATPNVHIAGSWNPLAGNQWTGQQMTLNELSSRPASSTQRYRDGTIRPNRAEKLLANEPHGLNAKRGLKQHETKQKDGSPWEKTPACFDLGFGADWITTTGGQHSGPPDDAYARPSRHADALARRCTPHMYQCIQQTKAVPSYAYVAKAGAAVGPSTGPTAPDWAMNPATVVGTSRATTRLNPPTQSPRLLKAENDLRMQLLSPPTSRSNLSATRGIRPFLRHAWSLARVSCSPVGDRTRLLSNPLPACKSCAVRREAVFSRHPIGV